MRCIRSMQAELTAEGKLELVLPPCEAAVHQLTKRLQPLRQTHEARAGCTGCLVLHIHLCCR